tara:strand:- start:6424 stop:6660 length:237 start_codon:yes stop_codon:yes gene_type:complete
MTVKRQIRRNSERRAKKKAKKQIERAVSDLNTMPKCCCNCQTSFDMKNSYHLDNWMIRVNDIGITMYCDKCKKDLKID